MLFIENESTITKVCALLCVIWAAEKQSIFFSFVRPGNKNISPGEISHDHLHY